MKFHVNAKRESRELPLSLKIAGIRDETDRIRVFDLVAADGGALPDHAPGAHLTFDLGAIGTRSYSLIDWPGDRNPAALFRIAVQREDAGAGGSRRMHHLAEGDLLSAEGPKNDFALADHPGPALLLAGGIGITPLIAMATRLLADGRDFALHYSGRSRAVMGFVEPLQAAFGPALTLYADDADALDLGALMGGLTPGTHLYVCGPRGMIDAARAAAVAAGLPEAQIHVELFSTPAPQTGDTAFEVELASTGQVFTVPPGKSIIDVLEEAGVDLIHDCRRGDCGICQTGVISGIPDHRDVVLSEAERAGGKLMQICVSRAKSPRLVLDL